MYFDSLPIWTTGASTPTAPKFSPTCPGAASAC